MAWEDIFAGFGGALSGAGEGLRFHQGMEMEKAKLAQGERIVDKQLSAAERLEKLKGEIQGMLQEAREAAATHRTGMTTGSNETIARGGWESAQRVAEMEDSTRRFTAAGGWKNNLQVTDKQGETSRAVAGIGANASMHNAGVARDESARQFDVSFPVNSALAAYRTQTDAQRPVAGYYPGQSVVTPNVTGFDRFSEEFAPTFRGMVGQPEPERLPAPERGFRPTPSGVGTKPAPLGPVSSDARPPAPVSPRGPSPEEELAALVAAPVPKNPQERARMAERIRALRQQLSAGAAR